MEFKVIGNVLAVKMLALKSTLPYLTTNIKTKNNDIILGKWQKKK